MSGVDEISGLLSSLRNRLGNTPYIVTREEALLAADIDQWPDLVDLGAIATRAKTLYCPTPGEVVRCAAEYNGAFCDQHCSFCLFGADAPAEVILQRPVFHQTVEGIVEAAKVREANGATRFKIVTTGRSLGAEQFARIVEAFRRIRTETNLHLCASLGFLTREQMMQLRQVGVRTMNNNLETSRRYFPEVCRTHSFDEKVEAIRCALDLGLEVCSGIVVGMGETDEDRVEAALTLRELGVESSPFNVFVPTRKEHLERELPGPFELLRSLAIFRLLLPHAKIMCNAGRQGFGAMHPLIYAMGANGYALCSYLTPQWDSAIDRNVTDGLHPRRAGVTT